MGSKPNRTRLYITKAEEIPQVEHFAIFESSSVHIPGEGEWAPGHGYPAHDQPFVRYNAFTNEAEFLAELKELQSNRFSSSRSFRGVRVSAPYTFETLVTPPSHNVVIPVSTGLRYPRD